MLPKVSAIIPVYNVEKYLERCLNSIISQSLTDIEIIIVNDGSPDNSQAIIDKYSAVDSRIKAVIKQNGGLGPARNTGIELATGEYIVFVDSDDWIEPEMFERLYGVAVRNSADIVVCNAFTCFDNGTLKKKFSMKSEVIEGDCTHSKQFLYDYFVGKVFGIPAWNKLYNTNFLKSNNLWFEENDKIFAEDLLFNLYCIVHVQRLALVDECFYNYFIRQTSILNTYKPLLTERYINLFYLFDNYLHMYDKKKGIREFCSILVFNALSGCMNNAFKYKEQHPQGMYGELHKFMNTNLCRQHVSKLANGQCLKNVPNVMWRSFVRVFCILVSKGAWHLACILQSLRFVTITGMKVQRRVGKT